MLHGLTHILTLVTQQVSSSLVAELFKHQFQLVEPLALTAVFVDFSSEVFE